MILLQGMPKWNDTTIAVHLFQNYCDGVEKM